MIPETSVAEKSFRGKVTTFNTTILCCGKREYLFSRDLTVGFQSHGETACDESGAWTKIVPNGKVG